MPIRHILNSFKQRNVLWNKGMLPVLRRCDISPGIGWEKTIEKIENEIDEGAEYDDKIESLKSCFAEHLLAGDSAVKLFRPNLDTLQRLHAILKSYKAPKTVYSSSYPLPLNQNEIDNLDAIPQMVKVMELGDGFAMIFCAVRTLEKIEKISNRMRKTVSYKQQFFDLVIFRPSKKLVEVRIDLNDHMSMVSREIAFEMLENKFNKICNELLQKEGLVLSRAINVFEIISNLYNSKEGIVSDLKLKTDEGSPKNEKKPKAGKDLRDEDYHKAGIAKLREKGIGFNIYNMTVQWNIERLAGKKEEDGKVSDYIELILPGQVINLSESPPKLEDFLVTRVISSQEYSFIFDKLCGLLSGNAQ